MIKGELKTYLCLTWINHVQVTKTGGKKVTRDETYSELVESGALLSRILARARSKFGSDSPLVTSEYEGFHAAVKETLKSRKHVKRTMLLDGRKLFTYRIRPLKLDFVSEAGTEYVIRENGKIDRVGGYIFSPTTKPEKPKFSPLPKPVVKPVGKVIQDKLDKVNVAPVKKAKTAPKVEVKSVVVPKPKGKKKDKGKPKAAPKVKDDTLSQQIKAELDKAKPSDKVEGYTPEACKASRMADTDKPVTPPKLAPKDRNDTTFTKSQVKECAKWGLDPLKLPDTKPKGFKNKIWKAMH